jgi:pyrroline-5-carboxylate reductase
MSVAILGVGVMGESLLTGLLQAGWDRSTLRVADSRPQRCDQIEKTYGVGVYSTREAVQGADAVVIVVKPHDVAEVLSEIGPVLDPHSLVISLAAGVMSATIESHLPDGQPVVRVMPNTPCLVGEGMAVVAPGSTSTTKHLAQAEEIMSAVGKVMVISEKYMDAVTAVSGSGPAYIMYVAEAMIDAGVMLGLPRATATELVKQTIYGSAKLLVESGDHPTLLKENVTSPGGTTAAALRAFEDHGVKAGFIKAMEAACVRSEELGRA